MILLEGLGNELQNNQKIINDENSKSLSIDNCFKCKWIKYSNKKT